MRVVGYHVIDEHNSLTQRFASRAAGAVGWVQYPKSCNSAIKKGHGFLLSILIRRFDQTVEPVAKVEKIFCG